MFAMMSSRVRKHRLGNDDVPFIKLEKNRGTQTDDGAPNREYREPRLIVPSLTTTLGDPLWTLPCGKIMVTFHVNVALHRAGICLLQYYTGPVSAYSSITQGRYLPAPVLHIAGICLLQYYT